MIPQLVIALTLVAEAGGLSDPEAMNRVLTVIANRAGEHATFEEMAKICLKPKQFSCWSSPHLMAKAHKHPKLGLALAFVKAPGERSKEIGNAKHYLTHNLRFSKKCPLWAKKLKIIYDEGVNGHVFLE